MKGVILAAGTGSRLVNLTRDLPKALVEVRGKPLIEYTLNFAEHLHCSEILVVGGFYFDKLQDYVRASGHAVRLIENREFLKGNIFTFIEAIPYIDEDFLLMNVDHVYPLRLAKKFLAEKDALNLVSAFVDFDRPLQEDDMKVSLQNGHTIAQISKSLPSCDAGYIGLTYVPTAKLERYKAAAKQVAAAKEDAVVENILEQLITDGEKVGIFPATSIRWLEVDNLRDLKNAERILKWVGDFLD